MSSGDLSAIPLPHDRFAEQAILGAIILRNDTLFQVADLLWPKDFYSPAHQLIFETMLELADRNQPVDEVTLGTILRDQKKLEQAGGADYLISLAESTPVADNVEHYARIVHEKGRLRELITTSSQIAEQGLSSGGSLENLLSQAAQSITEIESKSVERSYFPLRQILFDSFKILEHRSANPQSITGVPSGFTELDEITHGFQSGDLIILAARPSMGKTAFALNLAQYAVAQYKKTAVFFSLEMPKEQIAMRLLCMDSKVNSHKILTGALDADDWDKMAMSASRLMESVMYIDDQAAVSPLHVRKICRQIQKESGLDLVIVDYLQLMKAGTRVLSREQEISEISRSMKALAKEFKVPVIALSQLNRDLERRPNKRPMMADLRESGAIEQDADLILFIYRDEVYNEETEDAGVAEIIVAKHRNGQLGTAKLHFMKEYTKFGNLTYRSDDE